MNAVLSYSNDSDQVIYSQTDVKLGESNITLLAATLASAPEKPNEDAFAAAYQETVLYAGVFDGATSLKPIKSLRKQTGARFASHFLKDTFSQMPADVTPQKLILELNKQLLQTVSKFEDVSIKDPHTLPSSSGTVVKIDFYKNIFSFAHVSDSFGIAYYNDGHSALFTDDKNSKFDDKMFTLITHIAQEKGITPRAAREDEQVKKALVAMYNERNNNPNGKGCGVINGDPQAEQYIQTGEFPLEGIKAILIGTDGMPPLSWSEKNESDRQKMFEMISDGGFQKLFNTKKQTEDADPDWKYIRYKHSDDATGLLITL